MNYCVVKTIKDNLHTDIFGFINQLYNDNYIKGRAFRILTNIAISAEYNSVGDLYEDSYFPARMAHARGCGKGTINEIKSVAHYLKIDKNWDFENLSFWKNINTKPKKNVDIIKDDVKLALASAGIEVKDLSIKYNEIIISGKIL